MSPALVYREYIFIKKEISTGIRNRKATKIRPSQQSKDWYHILSPEEVLTDERG